MINHTSTTFDSPHADPESFDPSWGDDQLDIGWSPLRVARLHLSDIFAGAFDSSLVRWLFDQSIEAPTIGGLARSMGVESALFKETISEEAPTARIGLLRGFILAQPFSPFPELTASLSEIASYLEDVEVGDPMMPERDERRRLSSVCESNGWPWNHVAKEMRRRAIVAAASSEDPEEIVHTELGIPIYLNRFIGHQPLCPCKLNSFHLGHLASVAYEKSCGSPTCKRCGPEYADRVLKHLESQIQNLEEVHIAQAQWDKGLGNRMSARRSATGMNTFTHRAMDGTITIVSDKAVRGTAPPKSSVSLSHSEAMQFMIPILGVPDLVEVSWSDDWRPPGHVSGMGIHISTDDLSDEQRDAFNLIAWEKASRDYGVRKGGELPKEHWPRFREDMLKEKARLQGKKERKAT